MIQVHTFPIDLEDTTLDGASDKIGSRVDAALTELQEAGCRVLSVQLIALGLSHTSYGDAYRDHTHRESGVVVTITIDKPEMPDERRQAHQHPRPLRRATPIAAGERLP